MANPQLENGYIKMANELFDALCKIRINGEARQVLDLIIRKTYGFNKKQDAIALSQFCLFTGLKKPTICKAIKKLVKMNLILINQKDNAIAQIFRFNKDFDTWKPLPKKITLPKKIMSVTQKDNECYPKSQQSLPKKDTTKDTITKDTITKDTITKGCEQSSQDIVDIINIFKTINPTINFGNKTTRKATADLIKQFGKEKVVEYATYAISVFGTPYAPQITTPYELREKLSKLASFSAIEKNKNIIIKVAPAYKQ